MNTDFNKLILPTTILVASLILGGFFYASQVNKQRFIERQYVTKRKMECYEMYLSEKKRFNNVEDYGYVEKCPDWRGREAPSLELFLCQDDSCEIIYKDNKTGETFSKYY